MYIFKAKITGKVLLHKWSKYIRMLIGTIIHYSMQHKSKPSLGVHFRNVPHICHILYCVCITLLSFIHGVAKLQTCRTLYLQVKLESDRAGTRRQIRNCIVYQQIIKTLL